MARTLIAISILWVSCAMGCIIGDDSVQSVITEIISMRFVHHYNCAESAIVELRSEYPDDPTPLFLLGSNLQDHMLHCEDYRRYHEMETILDSAITLAKEDTSDIWSTWIIGSALGYKAIAQAEQGKYLPALRTSGKALDYLGKAAGHSETEADAALGIGGYHYWKSSKLGILTHLPFIPDRRREGIELLHQAREESKYSRDAATHALVYVYCEEDQPDSARMMRDIIAYKYPSSLLPLWYDLAIAEAENDIEGYFYAADELSIALDTLGDEQAINRIEVHLLAAAAAAEINDWALVCMHCTSILADHFPPWVIESSRDKIQELTGLADLAAENGAICPKFQ